MRRGNVAVCLPGILDGEELGDGGRRSCEEGRDWTCEHLVDDAMKL